jgi:hypothetical protein
MRRTLTMLVLAACLVAAAVVPAVALAHHGHGRDRRISGTVASFDNGVLAIKKKDGTVISANVTRRTEIECENENEANDSRLAHTSHDGGGDDNENENEDQAQNCDTDQLTPGTVVSRARLRDRGDRDFWKNLKLAS